MFPLVSLVAGPFCSPFLRSLSVAGAEKGIWFQQCEALLQECAGPWEAAGSQFNFVDVLGHVPHSCPLLCRPRGRPRAIANTSLALSNCEAWFKALRIC